uniref:Zinc knuckle CX2CX4HX4C n=1 Tax=Tanacetum cinerariifolium TaxID=118510 RepID=A0A6L2JCJ8_TANCI|nr:zinc knuckle CX2CX4HX4C [Tanacetum cinerariifolium]
MSGTRQGMSSTEIDQIKRMLTTRDNEEVTTIGILAKQNKRIKMVRAHTVEQGNKKDMLGLYPTAISLSYDTLDHALTLLVVSILKFKGSGYTTETIRVEYEWKPPRCDECKIFGHLCNNCPKKHSTSHTQLKAEKQKDVQEFFKVRNERQAKVVIRKANVKVKVVGLINLLMAPIYPKRNVVFSPETKIHYFDRDDMAFDDMGQGVEEVDHGNASSEKWLMGSMVIDISCESFYFASYVLLL